MMPVLSWKRYGQRGFTLLEVILAIVLMSVASVSLVSIFGQLGRSLSITEDARSAAQMAEECGEYLLGLRRAQGYTMAGVVDCSALGDFNGVAPAAVVLTDPYSGPACPGAASCKHFQVSAGFGDAGAQIQLVVVDY